MATANILFPSVRGDRSVRAGRCLSRIRGSFTLECAERTAEATPTPTHETLSEPQAEHREAVQSLIRLQLESGKSNEHARQRGETISLRRRSKQWRDWVKTQLARSIP